MSTSRPALRAIVAVFALAGLAQLPFFDRSIVSLDEGQLSAIGYRQLLGDVLYRDIYTGLFPGIYWLTAGLFAVAGVDLVVLRAAQLIVNAATAAGLFCLAQPMVSRRAAAMVAGAYIFLVLLTFPGLTMLAYSSLSLLAAIGALLAARRYLETASSSAGIATGLLLAACVLFKQNYGALVLLSVTIGLIWNRRDSAWADKPLLALFSAPVLSGAAAGAVAAGAILLGGAWPHFFEATFLTIFKSQLEAFHQPLPPVLGAHPPNDGLFVFQYAPSILFGYLVRGGSLGRPWVLSLAVRIGYGVAYVALALIPLLIWRYTRGGDASVRRDARLILPFAGLFFVGIFPSAIWSHLAAVFPPLILVLAAALSRARRALVSSLPAIDGAVRWAILAVCAVVTLVGAKMAVDLNGWYEERLLLPGASMHVSRREAYLYRAATDFLTECSREREHVFVAPEMPLLYVTSGKRNPTPYDLVIPGDVRDPVMVERLDATGVECIVYNPQMYVQFVSFDKLFPSLYAYLQEHFRITRTIESQGTHWQFLRRREARL
ncbi:MAG TPA: glycosyltransferase family 39 protein [Candidatus Binatia bacterium]|nr:glycosyltransferase family 39 protein [Candidatus Binatia bacterium]